ncbi:membrane protein [Cellulomonas cellasea DSM 20118]|uniref:Membrane protein n=2 Tax=Cellulomonas cellasea TaxID=43670 RepID=A0A0A0B7B4_9CELL|nr:membrane protein [Cellulomonas cellasea DSM 20118]GEA87600.1 hypothetical protein CCE01nite_15490 [Cellulomonas cellasea]
MGRATTDLPQRRAASSEPRAPRRTHAPRRTPAPATATAAPRTPVTVRAVTFPRVVAAEWTKRTSVRSALWLPLGTVVSALTLAYALGLFVRVGDARSGASLVVAGHVLAQLGTLVLGVLVGTEEHATGTATTTYAAVPRRLAVLGAQALVTASVALVTAAAALGASALVTHGQRAATGPTLDLGDGGTARVLAGFVVVLTGVALLGLGLGALLRRSAPALGAGVLLLVVADQLLQANPGRVTDTLRALLPGAGSRLLLDDGGVAALDAASLGPHLGPWGGGLVLAAWVVALLAAAAYRLRRHDVT